MAVTITPVFVGLNKNIADVEATADGDTAAVIPHGFTGFQSTPLVVIITKLLAAARTSDWIVTGIDGTAVTLGKTTGAGSGASGDQIRVTIEKPHTTTR